MTIKSCIFDVDNTLYSYDHAHAAAYRALTGYACKEFSLTGEEFNAWHDDANRILKAHTGGGCAAVHNRLIRYQLMLERHSVPLSHAPVMAELYWSTLLDNMIPAEGLHECFAQLRAAGLTIGIGTNMTADYQFAKLSRLGVLSAVDFLVSSEEAGAEKPDPRLFALCAEKAGCAAEECLFVGDDLKNDALGAQVAGMRAVWLSESAAEGGDRVPRIASLAELSVFLSQQ